MVWSSRAIAADCGKISDKINLEMTDDLHTSRSLREECYDYTTGSQQRAPMNANTRSQSPTAHAH